MERESAFAVLVEIRKIYRQNGDGVSFCKKLTNREVQHGTDCLGRYCGDFCLTGEAIGGIFVL